MLNMETSFELSDADGGTAMKWAADVKIAGPVGSMGQRVLQPIVNQQVQHVLSALDAQVQDAVAGESLTAYGRAVPHRRDAAHHGAARRDARVGARDGRGGHGHDLARRGLSVVAQARDGGALVDRSSPR